LIGPKVSVEMLYRAHRDPDPAPPATPACEKVRRLWDRRHQRWSAKILPGEIFVTRHDEFISTVLGTGIAVCVRDPVLRIGGMLLLMVPAPSGLAADEAAEAADLATRHGRNDLERLIDEVTNLGACRSRLKAKMFGGGRDFSGISDAAANTIALARRFLREQGLPLVEEKLGDRHPRRVMYFPNNGTALVTRLPPRYAASVASRETQYLNRLCGVPAAASHLSG